MIALKRICTAMLACALLLTPLTANRARAATVYAGRENAVVYDINGSAVAALPRNTALELTGMKGSVCQVSYKGHIGYMKKSDLAKQTAAEAEEKAMEKTAYVSKDGAKVRDADGSALGTLAINTQLTVTGVKGRVCRVRCQGRTGYMKKSDLSASPVSAESQKQETAVNRTAYVSKDGAKVYNARGKAVGKLPLNAQVSVVAVKGKACKISVGGRNGFMNAGDLSANRVGETAEARENYEAAAAAEDTENAASPVKAAKGTAKEMDWWTSGIQRIFARGVTATVTDVETGLAWREQRRGGTNHADVQPLTADDTATLKQAYGGQWSWNRRPIFVTIDGDNYAASMNGMPHGGGSIAGNNFNGHHCIHFTNSRTHGSNRVCSLHQAAIQKALEASL